MSQSSDQFSNIPDAPDAPPPAPDFHIAGQEDFLKELENCSAPQIQQKTAKIITDNLALSTKVKENKVIIEKLTQALPQNSKLLEEYNKKKIILTQRITSWMKSYTDAKDPMFSEIQKDQIEQMTEIQGLNVKIQNISNTISVAQTKISTLESENKALEEEQRKNRSKIATANATIKSLGGEVAAVLPNTNVRTNLLAELANRFKQNLEYTNLTHYCYKADGTYGDFPLHRIRKKIVETSHQSAADVQPHQIIEYLKRGIQDGSIDNDAIAKIIGFDPIDAQKNRIKNNFSKVELLSNLANYDIDKDGKPSNQTLPLLKNWFADTLGYDVEDDKIFAETFKKDIQEGRVTAAMINVAVNFDIEAAIKTALENRQTVGVHFSVQDSPKAKLPSDPSTSVRRSSPPPPPPPTTTTPKR